MCLSKRFLSQKIDIHTGAQGNRIGVAPFLQGATYLSRCICNDKMLSANRHVGDTVYVPIELHVYSFKQRTTKALIRLRGCAG